MALILSGDTGPSFVQAAAFPTGSVLQVISANNTLNVTTITSTSPVSLGLTATITPKFSTSKIYIFASWSATQDGSDANNSYAYIYRNSATNLKTSGTCLATWDQPQGNVGLSVPISFYDSPATTSATTYTIYGATTNPPSQYRPIAGTDTILLMEIAG